MTILLIDDDSDLCHLTKTVLTKSGYTVNAFNDASAGIKNARETKPNLILMDIMLPGLTGPEIVSSLRADSYFKDIPVVFLTGLVSGEEDGIEDEGLMVGGFKYPTLGKPYEIDKLLSMVKRYAR
jgi:DNA-binding response OmpR family regulator